MTILISSRIRKKHILVAGCLLLVIYLCMYLPNNAPTAPPTARHYNADSDTLQRKQTLVVSVNKTEVFNDARLSGSIQTSGTLSVATNLTSLLKLSEQPVIQNVSKTTQLPKVAEKSSTRSSEGKIPYPDKRSKIQYLKNPMKEFLKCNNCIHKKDSVWRMVLFVKSAAGNSDRREIIRSTWASVKYLNGGSFKTIFIVGKAVKAKQLLVDEEYERNGDILQINETDDYSHIAMKTLAGMQWASENLLDHDYYSTCDDDMMIYMDRVQEAVDHYRQVEAKEKWPEFPIVCTYELWDRPGVVFRNKKHKNYVSFENYKWTIWPKFCPGGMYTTSVGLIKQLYDLSRTQKIFLNTDDVWITGLLRYQLRMPDAMVVPVKPSAAKHYFDFTRVPGANKKEYLVKEWKKIVDNFKSKLLCNC